MKVLTYDQMKIEVMQITMNYEEILKTACDMTMKQGPSQGKISPKLLDFIVGSEHTSVLEHIGCTIKVTGVSRSFLAQITRHRVMSPTSASQHYQNYSDWPIVVSEKYRADEFMLSACDFAYRQYEEMVDRGVPIYEARQVLPNAAAVNMLMTWNLRSLLNFFRQRMCNRNVDEMRIFADRLARALKLHWPILSKHFGPPCLTDKKCNQGRMQCKEQRMETIWTRLN